MAVSQQVTHSRNIKMLKGISSLDEIRFDEKPLTAILGPNGRNSCHRYRPATARLWSFHPPPG